MSQPDPKKARHRLVLFTPVHGLEISPSIGGQIRIGPITFVSSAKLPRYGSRLKLPNPLSKYAQLHRATKVGELFKHAPSYAVRQTLRDPADKTWARETRNVQEALWILASSLFGREHREHSILSVHPLPQYALHQSCFVVDTVTSWSSVEFRGFPSPQPCILDHHWKNYTSLFFFFDLLRIVNGRGRTVSRQWQSSLKRAAILAGQSHLAGHLHEAFLYDMIAIESLLAERGDKYRETLFDRLTALFGWLQTTNASAWEKSIQRLYDLRCSFVHDGVSGDVLPNDLVLADELLVNLLINLCRNTSRFKCKGDLVTFAKRIEAKRVLGQGLYRKRENFTYIHTAISSSAANRVFDSGALWRW